LESAQSCVHFPATALELSAPVLSRLRAVLGRRGVGDVTVLKAFTILQSLLTHAVVEGDLDHNPARAVRKPRQQRERKVDPVPPEVVERMRKDLLDRGDVALALVVCLIAYAALRTLSEISELEARDIGSRVNARQRAQDETAANRRTARASRGGFESLA
jgi:site-specific recombinase XerC